MAQTPLSTEADRIDKQSIVNAEADSANSSLLNVKNRKGDVVASLSIGDANLVITPAIARLGAHDMKTREVVIKDFYHPNKPPKLVYSFSAAIIPDSPCDIAVSPCGRLLAFSSYTVNTSRLARRYNETISSTSAGTFGAAPVTAVGYFPDGKYLIAAGTAATVPNHNLSSRGWVPGNTNSNLPSVGSQATDVGIYTSAPTTYPKARRIHISRDGQLVVMLEATNAYAFKRDMTHAYKLTQITPPFTLSGPSDMSPDNKYFTMIDPTTLVIKNYLWDSTAGSLTLAHSGSTPVESIYTNATWNSFSSLRWSPNGKFVAVVTGNKKLLIYKFTGSDFTLVSSTTFAENLAMTWHASGRFIFVTQTDASHSGVHLYHVAVSTSGAQTLLPAWYRIVATTNTTIIRMEASPDGDWLYLIDSSGSSGSNPGFCALKGAEVPPSGVLTPVNPDAYEPSTWLG